MPSGRLRSALYVPAANVRALETARGLPVDAVILDLEDSVAPEAKTDARARACAEVRSGAHSGRTVVIRVNAGGTPWFAEDLAAAAGAGPDAILVPKVGGAEDLLAVEASLDRLGAPERVRLWAMLETPAGVLASADIARAGRRLDVLVMGTNDLLVGLRAEADPDRRPLQLSLMLCVLGARAADRRLLDGVYNRLDDPSGFAAECRAARGLGFDGKTLIHPSQIEACHRAFTPSRDELVRARRVIAAFEAAARAGAGVTTLDGRLIERLHADAAAQTLAAADAEPGLDPPSSEID